MDDYPSYPQLIGSELSPIDDIQVDRTRGGIAKARSLYSERKANGQLIHRLTPSEISDLMAFYDAHRIVKFNVLWNGDGQTYVCLFAAAPKIRFDIPDWAEVAVRLEVA